MTIPRLLGLATAFAFLSACGDTPTAPHPLDADLLAASTTAPSMGGPVVEHTEVHESFQAPCMTFMLEIVVDAKLVSQSWFYASGAPRRTRLHVNQDVTFTNLTSGVALKNNSNHNIEVRFDEEGNPTEQVENGAPQRIRESGGGKLLYYQIGHSVTSFDFTTSPPTMDVTFSGHSNADTAPSGPCEALGDPA